MRIRRRWRCRCGDDDDQKIQDLESVDESKKEIKEEEKRKASRNYTNLIEDTVVQGMNKYIFIL